MTPTREQLIEQIDAALKTVGELCDGTCRWTMSVPARPDSDPDLVIAGALAAAKAVLQSQGSERGVADGHVLVTVSGAVGIGKSAIAGEIEILCKALGLEVDWTNGQQEKNLTHSDWTTALELYKPKVIINESLAASPPPPAEQRGATCDGREPLPERDAVKPAEQQGVFRKFEVKRTDGSDQPGGKHEGCEYFVLDVDHDPHAQDALYAYTLSCRHTHPQLSKDMIERYDLVPPAEQAQGSDARDAARYRWLRRDAVLVANDPFIGRFNGSFSRWTGEDADIAIDAAICIGEQT